MDAKIISLANYQSQIQAAISKNQLNEALRIILKALEDYPTHAKLHINCGNLQFSLGLIKEAHKSYETSRKIYEGKEVLNNLGVLCIENKKYEQAIEYFLLALKYDNSYPDAHYNLSVCYDRKGDYDRTLTHIEK